MILTEKAIARIARIEVMVIGAETICLNLLMVLVCVSRLVISQTSCTSRFLYQRQRKRWHRQQPENQQGGDDLVQGHKVPGFVPDVKDHVVHQAFSYDK